MEEVAENGSLVTINGYSPKTSIYPAIKTQIGFDTGWWRYAGLITCSTFLPSSSATIDSRHHVPSKYYSDIFLSQ